PLGRKVRYRYDPMGNRIAIIDPRNKEENIPVDWFCFQNGTLILEDPRLDKSFTTWQIYDDLNRLTRTILPDATPPSNPFAFTGDNPYTVITYYPTGNVKTERDANGLVTEYKYTP